MTSKANIKPKPRLSIKLLWKIFYKWQTENSVGSNREQAGAHSFLSFVVQYLKSPLNKEI